MKFRKQRWVLSALAIATLVIATSANAIILKMDALKDTPNGHYEPYIKFDDNLGTLLNVTYFYTGRLSASMWNDGNGTLAAYDWADSITITASYTPIFQNAFRDDWGGSESRQVAPYDIPLDTSTIIRDYDFEFNLPLDIADDLFRIGGQFSAYADVIASQAADDIACYFGGYNYGSGSFENYGGCITASTMNTRVQYTYNTQKVIVSAPAVFTIMVLGVIGIFASRRRRIA
jgi:hypothetical protein